jgi:hypothetical protein
VFGGDTVIAGPFDNLGPGLENPVSFDLANGGSQIYLLYASGKLVAHSLYTYQEPEGQVADFGPIARDAQVLPDGVIYAGADEGIFRMEPGQAPQLLTDPGPVKLLRVKSPDVRDVFAVTTDDKVCRYIEHLDLNFPYLANPGDVTGLTSLDDPWIKNTKPLINDPIGAPVYYTLAYNVYYLYFSDPEGDLADVTAVIYSNTVQGAFFTQTLSGGTAFPPSGDTVITFPDSGPEDGHTASFWGGNNAGQMTIHVEADSADGQVSVRDFRINIEDNPFPPPPFP